MNLNEAILVLKEHGYICEKTDLNVEDLQDDVINKNTIGESMNFNKAKQILEQAGYVIENPQINEVFDAKDVYLTKAVNIFLKDNPGWLEEFTKEELLEVFGARSDIDDYIGQVPPGVFAEEMEDIDLFQNCAEKAGF